MKINHDPNLVKMIDLIRLVLLFIFLAGCKSEKKNGLFYRDFDFKSGKGLESVEKAEFELLDGKTTPLIELIIKQGIVDSMIIMSFEAGRRLITHGKVFTKGQSKVYYFELPLDEHLGRNIYIVSDQMKVIKYFFVSNIVYADSSIDCIVTKPVGGRLVTVTNNVLQYDTIGFVNKLLDGDSIKFQKIDTIAVKQWDREFRLTSFFNFSKN